MTGFLGLVTKSVKGRRGDVGRFVTLKTGRVIFIRKGGYPGPGHCGLPGQVGGSRPRGACGGGAVDAETGGPEAGKAWVKARGGEVTRSTKYFVRGVIDGEEIKLTYTSAGKLVWVETERFTWGPTRAEMPMDQAYGEAYGEAPEPAEGEKGKRKARKVSLPTGEFVVYVEEDIERAFEDDLADRFASTDEYKKWATGLAKDMVATSGGMAVNVPVDVLDEIVNEGRLRNAFEGTEEKFKLPEHHDEYMRVRRELDEGMFDLGLDAPAADRPIYGYLLPPDVDKKGYVANTYGDVYLHLRKDVEERATVSFGDSLDECADNQPRLAPSPLSDPNYLSFNMFSDDNNPLWEDWGEGDGTVGDLVTYAETQIFGGVALGDIERISLPKGTDVAALMPKLEEAGIEIEYY